MRKLIHIVDRFEVPWSGSAHEALEIYRLLQPHADVQLWSQGIPHESYAHYDIRHLPANAAVGAGADLYPVSGTLILIGGHYWPESWLEQGCFSRIVIKLNTTGDKVYENLFRLLGRIRSNCGAEPDLVFVSALVQTQVGLPGIIEPSPLSLSEFVPAGQPFVERPFTLGRHSRDIELKHHEDDPSLYRMLALQGHQVRLMGGTCLDPYLGRDRQGIALLPAGALSAPEFLRGLDCFFYRTYPTLLEAFGRVVMEAMACGLPVVCERRGGYADWIRHGENGFLFDTQEEAYLALQQLATSPDLRETIGKAARLSVEALFGAASRESMQRWYLR